MAKEEGVTRGSKKRWLHFFLCLPLTYIKLLDFEAKIDAALAKKKIEK